MAEKPKIQFSLDGKNVEVPEGTSVLDAARQVGVEIPHYCSHPALGNPGNCRFCMVEVEGMPKLQPSCRLGAKQGMVVKSNSPQARRAQASSLEFHLVNHPLDCPVCDQAGECWLQDYYMRFGLHKSAVKENKRHKKKRVEIGNHVMLDSERCILCTRCTRFVDNVTKTHELGIFNRGGSSEIALTPGHRLDNPYSGNVVDICPVGALTDKDFRFKVRVWYLDRTPSVCVGCSRGCSISIYSNNKRPWHTGGKRLARVKPRTNPEVNGWWMCDEGRYGLGFVDAPTRLQAVSLLESGKPKRVNWKEALERVSNELKENISKQGSSGLAVILSGTLSNEDLWTAKRLFVDRLHAGHVMVFPGPDQLGEEDEILRRKEKVPNHRGAQAMGFGSRIKECSWEEIRSAVESGKIWGLYVVDRDPASVWKGFDGEVVKKLPFSAFQGVNSNKFAQWAQWVLPACSFAEEEATYVNFEGQVQRTAAAFAPVGDSWPDWRIWGGLLKEFGEDFPEDSPRAVFDRLCGSEPAFAGLRWEDLAPNGKRVVNS